MKAEYINHMGDDLTVVNAAKVSFDKESEWEYVPETTGGFTVTTRKLFKRDEKLTNYLSSHDHFTPFTHCFVTMRETVPIFVARQRFKHTVGFSYNEVSRRYVDSEPEFFTPDGWRRRAENIKQGSSLDLVEDVAIDEGYHEFLNTAINLYRAMIDGGIAPEQARMVLPQSMYTSYYVSGSLAAWARAYNLRIQPDAQVEIQDLARMWGEIISPLFPVSWGALVDEV